MGNTSSEVSLEAHSGMVKEGADHQPVVLFKKDNMDAYQPVLVVNITRMSFIGGPSNKGRTGNIQGAWDPDRSVAVVIDVGVPAEEALSYMVMNARIAVICLECDCEEYWLK